MQKINELDDSKAAFLLPTLVGKQVFGWKNQTSYNHIFRNTFPFPLYLIGKTKMVKVSDIQSVIDGLKPVQNAQPALVSIGGKRRRGRPTKASQIAANAALKSGGAA